MASTTHGHAHHLERSTIQTVTTIVAATFLLVGIAGFIPGITSNLDDVQFAGHESGAELLGIFQVSILHNIVHLAFGLVGLLAARMASTARQFLIVGGAIYGILWLYGLLIDKTSDANFVPLNTADDWLHFALSVGMIGLGVLLGRDLAGRRS